MIHAFAPDGKLTKPTFVDSETTGTQACLAALFQALRSDPRDDREKLLHRKGSRVDGTCRWITSDKLYDSWLKSHSGLLWLSGGPGGGKTMLSIFLAEELERKAKESQNAVLLEFFCDNKDERRNTASSVVCGLLFRLLQLRPKLFDHILPTFNIQKEQLFAAPSFESLWRIFSAMVHDPDAGSVYCVLDGLDECNETASELLLQRLKSVLTRSKDFSPCCLHVIVASRDFPEVIPEVLSSFSRIRLDGDAASDVKVDIRNFIDVKIDELSRYRDYPPFLRHRMRKTFQDRANGTFLWIGIVAQALRKYKASEAEKALDLFPSGLDAIYARLLLQVEVNRRETVAKILRWVVMAVRPLTLSELSAALQLEDASSNDFDREEVMKDQISHCGYLLTLENEKVNLIHQSAKEYLLGETHVSCYELKLFHIDQPRANLEIARTCLQYLHNGALAEKIDHYRDLAARERLFPMLSYAVYNWPHHAKSLARSEDIFDLSHPFYAEESPVRTKWLTTYVLAGPWHVLTPITSRLLLIASSFGILPLVENLLVRKSLWHTFKRKSYVNQKDSMGLTALDYAAVRGQKAVVSLLIDHGARHQEHTDPQQAALSMAAIFGHESVVSLLLENSDRLGVTDRDKVEALQSAAFKGSEAMFWTILKHQEKVQGNNDLKHRAKEQALVSAAYGGNVPAIRALLDHGVHVDSKDDRRKTALHASAWRSDGATARLLLDRRADINSKDRSGRTPLHDSVNGAWSASNRATQNSAETVMRLLLTEKADIEAETNIGRTALHLAAEVRSESLIRCLLEGGARLRAKDHEGLTALDLAAAAAQATDDHQPQGYRTFLRVQYEPVMRLLTAREE